MEVILLLIYVMYLPLSFTTYKLLEKNAAEVSTNDYSSLCLKWIMGVMSTFFYFAFGIVPKIAYLSMLVKLSLFGFIVYVIMPESKGHNIMYMGVGKLMIQMNYYFKVLITYVYLGGIMLCVWIMKYILSRSSFIYSHIKLLNNEFEKLFRTTQRAIDIDDRTNTKKATSNLPSAYHNSLYSIKPTQIK